MQRPSLKLPRHTPRQQWEAMTPLARLVLTREASRKRKRKEHEDRCASPLQCVTALESRAH